MVDLPGPPVTDIEQVVVGFEAALAKHTDPWAAFDDKTGKGFARGRLCLHAGRTGARGHWGTGARSGFCASGVHAAIRHCVAACRQACLLGASGGENRHALSMLDA